jgi:hypothetical protein
MPMWQDQSTGRKRNSQLAPLARHTWPVPLQDFVNRYKVREETTVQIGIKSLLTTLGLLYFLGSAQTASAKCSEERIRRLFNDGNTIGQVSEKCSMSQDVVKYIFEKNQEDEEDDDPTPEPPAKPQLLPAGTPVGQCGCWGYVDPGHTQQHAQCESGRARPQMCNMMCPAGGYMWQGVCM